MKKILFLFWLTALVSCGDVINQPKNLLSQDQMAEVIAELAVNDQLSMLTPNFKMSEQTTYIFNKEKIKAKDFTESYKYYLAKGKMDKILDQAQKDIVKMDPKAKEYINKKREGQPSVR